jgi:uncharacterized protein (DUF1800 family)
MVQPGVISVEQRPLHLLNRLAFGPRPGDIETVKRLGPERWIEQQLNREAGPRPPELVGQLEALETIRTTPIELFMAYARPQGAGGPSVWPRLADSAVPRSGGETSNPAAKTDSAVKQAQRRNGRVFFNQAMQARLYRALAEPNQLQEVMTAFWFNHFNVFVGKGLCHLWIAPYEEEAIRPYALGRFRDLLGATAKHPAMLFYLDNWQNTAPNSPGKRGKFEGINENYARELMELHTLGVNGGYTQNDVIALAHILTGWGIIRGEKQGGGPWRGRGWFDSGAVRTANGFFFDPSRHDFSDQRLLGDTIPGGGIEAGERALDRLARYPATARHLSYQLAQYFVADDPPPALVERMAGRYLATDGQIRAVLATMFSSSEFWDPQYYAAKFKTPYEFVLSAVRATGVTVRNPRPLINTMAGLGMPLFGCQTPDGYKNTRDAWLNPDAMMMRLSFATGLGSGHLPLERPVFDFDDGAGTPRPVGTVRPARYPGDDGPKPTPLDPTGLAMTLGDRFSLRTIEAVGAAPLPLRASLILGSPEFMMR